MAVCFNLEYPLMTKFLQLIGMVLVASALTAEEAKVEVTTAEHKAADTVVEPAKAKDVVMPAAHEHVNRKAADALSARLNAMTAPYAVPLTTIPEMPACCGDKKPVAHHGHAAAAMHHKVAAKHVEKKAADHKKEEHQDAKH